MPPSPSYAPSQSASSAWECQKCNVSNTTKRCSSCHAWKDGVTPLMASRLAKKKKKNNDAVLRLRRRLPVDENANPNYPSPSSPYRNHVDKKQFIAPNQSSSRNVSLSPSSFCPPSPLESHPPTQPSVLPLLSSLHPPLPVSLPPPMPLVECRGVYNGNFGQALILAGKSFLHTGHEILRMARNADGGLKEFLASVLSKSRSICLPYCGVILHQAQNSEEGYIFRAETCDGGCPMIGGRLQSCPTCLSRKSSTLANIRKLSNKSVMERAKECTTIKTISMNPELSAIEIKTLRAQVKRLERQVAERVLACDMQEVPDAATGEQI